MKQFTVFIFILGIVLGCSKKKDVIATDLQKSYGNRNEIVLVIDDSLWISAFGDSVREELAKPNINCTDTNPVFDLIQLDPKIFNNKTKTARNIILFSLNSKNQFLLQKSVNATPQNFFTLMADQKSDLLNMFKTHADSIVSVFRASELNEEMHYVVRSSTQDLQELKDYFGCTLKIPNSYHLQVKNEFPFLWYQKDLASGNINLILYEFPISEIENNKASIEEYLMQARNFIGKKFMLTAKDSAYIITDLKTNPIITNENLKELPAYKIVGNWESVNDYLKGPFICYAIRDDYYKRYLFIEGYINNPFKQKRDHLLEIEAIVKTINFNE